MSLFYNIYINNSNLKFFDEESDSLIQLSFYNNLNSFTKVDFEDENVLYDTSVFINVNKPIENYDYKKELLSVVNLLIDSNSSFLLSFNGDLPLIFNTKNKCYLNDKKHFNHIDIINFIKTDMSQLTFIRNPKSIENM
jgi:hypothetical protein